MSPRRAMERDLREQVERFQARPSPPMACRPPGRGRASLAAGRRAGHKAATTGHDRAQSRPRRAAGRAGPKAACRGQEPPGREAVLPVRSERGRGLAEELWWEAAPPPATSPSTSTSSRPPAVGPTRSGPRGGDPGGRPARRLPSAGRGPPLVAYAELGDRTLTLRGRDLPVESGQLVRVLELEPLWPSQLSAAPRLRVERPATTGPMDRIPYPGRVIA